MDDIEHKCGLTMTYHIDGEKNVVPLAYNIACHLENRGEDAAGIAYLAEGHSLRMEKREGLVSKELQEIAQTRFGIAALIHNRYTTNGGKGRAGAQPFHYTSRVPQYEIAIGHNGNIHTGKILKELQAHDIDQNIASDTDAIGRLLKQRLSEDMTVPDAVRSMWDTLDGAHNIAGLRRSGDAFVWRDERGMHPLVFGQKNDIVVVASEDNAIRQVLGNAVQMRDVAPGELLEFKRGQEPISHQIARATPAHCIFEWWYFAKRWSRLDGASVYLTRHRAGEVLGELDRATWEQEGIEPIVVPVPNSAVAIMEGYVHTLDHLERSGGIIRNPRSKRTFITDSEHRQQAAKDKYDVRHRRFEDEHVVLIDDSIVRGTTLRPLVHDIRSKQPPKSVHVRIAFPPVLAPCFYGINMSTLDELFMTKFRLMELDGATQEEIEREMARDIEADSVRFLPIARVADVIGLADEHLCKACTRGQYPTPTGQRQHDTLARQIGLLPPEA